MIIFVETEVRLISVACKNRSPFISINPHFGNPVFPYSLWTSFLETNHPKITMNEVKRATLRKACCRDKSGETKHLSPLRKSDTSQQLKAQRSCEQRPICLQRE
jgi:hypothetical protein